MSTFTKEQLIEQAKKNIEVLRGAAERIPGASDAAVIHLKLAEITLASLEAEPAIHRWRRVTSEPYGPYPWHYGDFIGFSKPVNGLEDEYFYSAPPAPVSMKDHQIRELVNELRDIAVEYHGTQQLRERIARTVRAAMLQGADSNSPVIPDGWVACSERMPETDGNYWGWWSESKRQGPVWFMKSDLQAQFQSSEITHWMPLPAAPLQEVKP
ncbi:DUF551 domain-containing protein [Enterobacter cloacae]|uniref:DUF551 domain-containing protein n=1 Tax=Enterobacter cloacae TaxID=550 RepID=UPI00390668E7